MAVSRSLSAEAPLLFKVFCLEEWRRSHDVTGRTAAHLFARHGVLDYLGEYFDVLHQLGGDALVADIDAYLAARD